MRHFLQWIEAKREGAELDGPTLEEIVQAFLAGQIPDYQMSAFLMAVFFRGLSAAETRALTCAMRDSGSLLSFPDDPRPLVDKHSTGGVGDKVSLPLVPLLAELGCRVPMISGRGLGITGGTLDKLEAIPGFNTRLEPGEIVAQVQAIGCAICGQTESMVPADRRLYALRDATGTVPSMPLITSSILSKKLAESLSALLLDVKWGRAAFMKERREAGELARAMVSLGRSCGVHTIALVTEMERPLGRAAGNWLEVAEAVACLRGEGPRDLKCLVVECAARLLMATSKMETLDAARQAAGEVLASGRALSVWERMLEAQGASMDRYGEKLQGTSSPHQLDLRAETGGVVVDVDARRLGEAVRTLGGGRWRQDDRVDPEVGLDAMAQVGDSIDAGGLLCRVHARTRAEARRVEAGVRDSFVLGRGPAPERVLVTETVS